MLPDLMTDPFGERCEGLTSKRMQLLGAAFRFDSNSAELMGLVDCAYRGLPGHRLSGLEQELRVSLLLTSVPQRRKRAEPSPLAMISGSGFLGGAAETANFVVVSPREHAALVVVSPPMLRFPYHARYELIEFAVFTLAARAQRLVPLHAACIGQRGRAILLFGPSGSGKSTVALHCLLDGFDFLSEDSAFVSPDTMLATGVSNFVHIRANSLRWIGRSREAAVVRKSPVIRRRSGVKKFEVDLRRDGFRLAKSPPKIVSLVFLSPETAGNRPLLKPISRSALLTNLAESQGYAASQPQWQDFRKKVSHLNTFELRRGRHPHEAVEALRTVLMRN
jgi:energy-coupling factor transporter ATP-binding protein EcfA2